MLSLLLSMAVATPLRVVEPPINSPRICDEILYELDQSVQFEILTKEQAIEVYLRCLADYL